MASQENDENLRAMKAAEAILVATANEDKARIADADRQGRELRDNLAAVEAERGQVGLRLEQASRDIEMSRAENINRAATEQVRQASTGQVAILLYLMRPCSRANVLESAVFLNAGCLPAYENHWRTASHACVAKVDVGDIALGCELHIASRS